MTFFLKLLLHFARILVEDFGYLWLYSMHFIFPSCFLSSAFIFSWCEGKPI